MMDEDESKLVNMIDQAISDFSPPSPWTETANRPLTPEDFHKAVEVISKERIQPSQRIYNPTQFELLREDAEAFEIDTNDPQWDLLVQHEWAKYRSFERYLVWMGWRPESDRRVE